MTDLLTRLRQLARAEHDDLDIVDEAAEEIINLRVDVHVLRELLERYKRAAIEADRKQHDRMLAHEWIRPALGLSEDAPYRFDFYAQQIEGMKADRKHKGEVVVTKTPEGEIIAVTRQDDEGRILSVIAESDRKRRTPPREPFAIVIDRIYDGEGPSLAYWNGENYQFSDGDCFNREGDTLDGYTAEFLTDYQLEQRLFSYRQRRGEPVGYVMPSAIKQLKAGGNAIVGGLPQGGDVAVYLAPQPAEPVKKKDWNVELSSWSDEDFVQVFHERPDLADRLRRALAEPVKVPSEEEVLKIAIDSGLAFRNSTGEVLCAWREDADISEYLVKNARALLERYIHLTTPIHKSSKQNQLKG